MGEFCLASYVEPSEYCYRYGQNRCISRLCKFQEHRMHHEKRLFSDQSPRVVTVETVKARNRTFGGTAQRLCSLVIEPQRAVEPAQSWLTKKRGLAPPRRCVSPEDQNETANSTPMVLGSFQYPRVAMPPMVWPNSSLSSVRFLPYTVTR